jgi:hypothetical protein
LNHYQVLTEPFAARASRSARTAPWAPARPRSQGRNPPCTRPQVPTSVRRARTWAQAVLGRRQCGCPPRRRAAASIRRPCSACPPPQPPWPRTPRAPCVGVGGRQQRGRAAAGGNLARCVCFRRAARVHARCPPCADTTSTGTPRHGTVSASSFIWYALAFAESSLRTMPGVPLLGRQKHRLGCRTVPARHLSTRSSACGPDRYLFLVAPRRAHYQRQWVFLSTATNDAHQPLLPAAPAASPCARHAER